MDKPLFRLKRMVCAVLMAVLVPATVAGGAWVILTYVAMAQAHRNPAPVVIARANVEADLSPGTWVSAAAEPVAGSQYRRITGRGPLYLGGRWLAGLEGLQLRDQYHLVQLPSGHRLAVVENQGGRWYTYWHALRDWTLVHLLRRPALVPSAAAADHGLVLGMTESVPPDVQAYYENERGEHIAPFAINLDRRVLPVPLLWRRLLLAMGATVAGAALSALCWRLWPRPGVITLPEPRLYL